MFTIDSAVLGWAALAVVAAIVEAMVPHFGIIFAAIGAVAAIPFALLSLGAPVQVVVFLAGTAVSMALLRQRFVKNSAGHKMPSRADAHIGREGVVTIDVEPVAGSGRVSVGGEDWAARAEEPIGIGSRVRVVGSDGIVLKVRHI